MTTGIDQPTDADRELSAREDWERRISTRSDEQAVTPVPDLDPAVLVTPPKGLEIGYVPIVTHQRAKE